MVFWTWLLLCPSPAGIHSSDSSPAAIDKDYLLQWCSPRWDAQCPQASLQKRLKLCENLSIFVKVWGSSQTGWCQSLLPCNGNGFWCCSEQWRIKSINLGYLRKKETRLRRCQSLKFLDQIGCLRIFIGHRTFFAINMYWKCCLLLKLEECEGRYLKTQHANVKASRSNLK